MQIVSRVACMTMAAAMAVAAADAVSAQSVAYPQGYRRWTHVKSMQILPGHPPGRQALRCDRRLGLRGVEGRRSRASARRRRRGHRRLAVSHGAEGARVGVQRVSALTVVRSRTSLRGRRGGDASSSLLAVASRPASSASQATNAATSSRSVARGAATAKYPRAESNLRANGATSRPSRRCSARIGRRPSATPCAPTAACTTCAVANASAASSAGVSFAP